MLKYDAYALHHPDITGDFLLSTPDQFEPHCIGSGHEEYLTFTTQVAIGLKEHSHLSGRHIEG